MTAAQHSAADHLATDRQAYLRRHGLIGLVLGVAGIIGCALGYGAEDHRQFLAGYLVAFMFWLGLSLGSLVVATLHGVTGGGWGLAVRRIAEAGYSTLPLMGIFFIPLAINVRQIYPWADSSTVAADELLQRKAWWLNVDGWLMRAAIYFGIWIVTMLLLNLLSPNDDPNSESPRGLWLQRVSGIGLIAYGFTITLASVDWVMSLEPHWYSSIYGVIYMGGQALAGMSLVVLVAGLLEGFPPWNVIVTTVRRHDLGNLMLAMVMFWAYVSFMQYLIIWSGDLPEENAWYLARSVGGYELVAMVLMFLHFALPFLLLLSRDIKQHRQRLMVVAGWLLLMRLVDIYFLAMPAFYPRTLTLPWQMWAALVGIGGFWLAVFAWRLSARAALPMYDPVLAPGTAAEGHA